MVYKDVIETSIETPFPKGHGDHLFIQVHSHAKFMLQCYYQQHSQSFCCSQRAKMYSSAFQATQSATEIITLLAPRLSRVNKSYGRFVRWNIVVISKRKIYVIMTIHKRIISLAGKRWSPMKGWVVFCWILQAKLLLPFLLFSPQQHRYPKVWDSHRKF